MSQPVVVPRARLCRPCIPRQIKMIVVVWAVWQCAQVLLLWAGARYGGG